jgi:hypothetical protein
MSFAGWSLTSDVRHREVAEVVRHDNGSVDASCPGNQGIGCVDRLATSLKIGLVAAGAARGLSGCLQELQPVEERR